METSTQKAMPEVTLSADTVIAIRDALVANDTPEAYHLLYQAVDPSFSRYEPWVDTEATLVAPPAQAGRPHVLTDRCIAENWPDADTPEGRAEIRRQFDALMAQIRNASCRPFPRFPEVMAPVVIEKARLLPERMDIVKAALDGLPVHWRQWQWEADKKPMFGEKYVRASITGDNGHGFGRQWIASVNHISRQYVGSLADFIAAANPDTVSMMVARIEELESQLAIAPSAYPNSEEVRHLAELALEEMQRRGTTDREAWVASYERIVMSYRRLALARQQLAEIRARPSRRPRAPADDHPAAMVEVANALLKLHPDTEIVALTDHEHGDVEPVGLNALQLLQVVGALIRPTIAAELDPQTLSKLQAAADRALGSDFLPFVEIDTLAQNRGAATFVVQDVIDLVIAAREAFDCAFLPEEESRALDKALEPFEHQVRYADEPDEDAATVSKGISDDD